MAISQAHLLLLLLVSLFFLPSLPATSVSYCDKKGKYPVQVNGVKISPDPVLSGQPATFKILGSSSEDISGGEVEISVSYFGIHVHTETHDLCEETSCPVSTGSFVLSHTQTLPSFTPPGSYTLRMTMSDTKGKKLTCISFGFKIALRASVSDI
ncbi:PREDICTED: putative phosphatidylglycerol/phosphatidylinositol transfer protein DDB_G0282179 [Tarenaya hassleriana]|uniref:putative phosphatidylglycerol/phosphatidylinositol transfer protein DDB_G0282179 n=1 Tax=Tarenaya hassleriana TaxID=28532 RepID=UPI00053C40B3|nr:PREDICTED: putative phosphatidylglycerol/phosphatidylinositol transfer protein DDB_G0282179 [Tarenaya hassleriana]